MRCSVIVPLYNKAPFVEAAIGSILRQQHQQFEIIVVDDGSTDDGPARVRRIHDPRITLVQQVNSGVSVARNRGIDCARGALVCFLDADDWYLPGYLATVVALAERYPETSFFGTAFRRVSSSLAASETYESAAAIKAELVRDFFHRWRFRHFVFTGSIAVRREALLALQPCFAPGMQMGEDQDLWFRLAERYSLAYCPLPLVAYRIDVDGSLCADHRPVYSLAPEYRRLEDRVSRREVPAHLRAAALRLVTEEKVSVARNLIIAGRRYDALMQLARTWRGLASRRWWVTLGMCALATPSGVRAWEHWRHQRVRDW